MGEFFSRSGAVMLVCDSAFRILDANKGAENIFGVNLAGKHLHRFVSNPAAGLCTVYTANTEELDSAVTGLLHITRTEGDEILVVLLLNDAMDGKGGGNELVKENQRLSKLVEDLLEVSITDITQRKNLEEQVRLEKERSERLVRNVLPDAIIPRIQGRMDSLRSHPIADFFETGSVLFTDIVGFTQMSSAMSAVDVVSLLNDQFSLFDDLADEFGVTKVKTIGDAYMAVAGVPNPCEDHAERLVKMAMAMVRGVQMLDAGIQIRVGVSSGPLVAGIVGTSRFLYDVWGDTVNVASRMESSGVPGRVQVSRATVEACEENDLHFEHRGEIEIKGKGAMDVYLVDYEFSD